VSTDSKIVQYADDIAVFSTAKNGERNLGRAPISSVICPGNYEVRVRRLNYIV